MTNFSIILVTQVEYILFLRVDGEWKIIHVTGKRQDEWTYVADSKYECFPGQSIFGWKSWDNVLR